MVGEEYILSDGVAVALLALGLGILFLIITAVGVYMCFAWYTIAKKLGYKKAWLAWIPIANFALILQLGGFDWKWIWLILLPILGWIPLGIMLIIAQWKVFERRNYPGWLILFNFIPQLGMVVYMVVIGLVAWSDRKKRAK